MGDSVGGVDGPTEGSGDLRSDELLEDAIEQAIIEYGTMDYSNSERVRRFSEMVRDKKATS